MMRCNDCGKKLERKSKHDTYIPLGEVLVWYCSTCDWYTANIRQYKDAKP